MDPVSSKLLTISIAAYNAEATLGRALDSVELEYDKMSLLDIIIVNDGSDDETESIARRFAELHPGCARVISKPNGGYGSAVNAAIDCARGRWFRILDADDAYDKNGLRALLDALSREDSDMADMIISPYMTERLTGSGERFTEICDSHPDLQLTPIRLESADTSQGLAMFEICVRTDVLRASGVRLTEKCYYTDNEFVMAAILYSGNVMRLPAAIYRYSLGDPAQSMSIDSRKTHINDKIEAARGTIEIYSSYAENSGMPHDGITGTRRELAEILISTMVREVYVSCMITDKPLEYRETLREFDRDLGSYGPEVMRISGKSRLVRSARSAGNAVYRLLCGKVLRDEADRTGPASYSAAASLPPQLRVPGYIAAICMLIQCRTIYMHLHTYGMYVNRICWAVLMAALAICAVIPVKTARSGHILLQDITGRYTYRSKTLMIVAGTILYAGIFVFFNPVNYLRVIRCTAAVIMMILLARSQGGRTKTLGIIECYRNIVLTVAGVSLLCWIFGSTLHILPGTGFVAIDWSPLGRYVFRPTFIGIYFETQWTGWELVPARNTGIFVEAPMAGFNYSLALIIECYISGQSSRRCHRYAVCLLLASIITTFSAISYIMLVMVAIERIIRDPDMVRNMSAPVRILAGTGTCISAAVILVIVYLKFRQGSGIVRLNDFEVGFRAWLAHPLFGGGFESLEYLQSFMPEWRQFIDIGYSNSPMEILAQCGIWLGIVYIAAFAVPAARAVRIRDRDMLISMILFAYLFIFTVVPYQYITFMMLVYFGAASESEMPE